MSTDKQCRIYFLQVDWSKNKTWRDFCIRFFFFQYVCFESNYAHSKIFQSCREITRIWETANSYLHLMQLFYRSDLRFTGQTHILYSCFTDQTYVLPVRPTSCAVVLPVRPISCTVVLPVRPTFLYGRSLKFSWLLFKIMIMLFEMLELKFWKW